MDIPVPDVPLATGQQSMHRSTPAARSEDEDLVAVVENDACGINAIFSWLPAALRQR